MRVVSLRVSIIVVLLLAMPLSRHESSAQAAGDAGAATAQESEGRFVFTRHMSGTYLRTADGEDRIAYLHGDYACPRLLPGQGKIVFNSLRGGRIGIWTQDIETGALQRICDGDQVSVDPAGRFIAFRRDGAIILRELATGTEETVSPEGWSACAFPSFHPDGRVLFVATEGGKDRAYLADASGNARPALLFDGAINSTPRCSPDGRTVAYPDGAHLYLFDLATKRQQRLTFAGGVQSWPMWSRDGKSVAYVQAPTPVDGPKHVYRVEVANPKQVSLLLTDVEAGPDWNGLGFSDGDESTLPGDGVRFWQSEGRPSAPVHMPTSMNPEVGWHACTPNGASAKGEVVVECEWGTLYLSGATGELVLAARHGGAFVGETRLSFLGRQGDRSDRIEAVRISPPGVDLVAVSADVHSPKAGTVRADITVCRSRPVVEIRPAAKATSVLIERPLALAVAPDRLASDLIYNPADYDSPSIALPWSPFTLGMARDASAVLMVATPSRQQRLQLVKVGTQEGFARIEAHCAGGALLVAVLPGSDLWRTTEVKPTAEGKPCDALWSNPFAGQWRLAAQGGDPSFAVMELMDSPTREKDIELDDVVGLAKPPTQSVIYLYGRSENTPLDQVTPVDVLEDVLGIDATAALMDTEGVRTYRHADQWVPYKDPRVALKILSWIRRRARPGGQERIDGVCGDILLSLQGLDSRRKEYESFAAQLEKMNGRDASPAQRNTVLESVGEMISQLRASRAVERVTPMEDVTKCVEGFRSGATRVDALRRCVTDALSERLRVLSAYRSFAKRVRIEAGLSLARFPGNSDESERIRDLAGQVLRKRYYLEADWLGEDPLGGPEVSYEQVSDL